MGSQSVLSLLPAALRHAVVERGHKPRRERRRFVSGLPALDELLPGGSFVAGAAHELLVQPQHPTPLLFAAILARSAAASGGAVAWLDARHDVYPPALAAAGIPIERLHLLRPRRAAEVVPAVTECCRCAGVAATVAELSYLSRVEARRLQLAAEQGGGVGILIRRTGRAATFYAAATRWLVAPRAGDASVRRWDVQLLHGHGGHVGQAVILEVNRETNHVRAVEALAHRPAAPQATPVPA